MSAQVLSRVRAWIASSGMTEGARLPPERDLSARLGISRAELRKALLVLEAGGSVTREVGRGTYLAKRPGSGRSRAGSALIDDLAERTGPQEAMTARLALEPELARLAAMQASPLQLRELRRLAGAMRGAATWLAYEEADQKFHDLIAEASGNALLHELHRILNGVRFVVVWRRLDTSEAGPPDDYRSFAEHEAIVAALEDRNPVAAGQAMRAHLQSTLAKITDAG